MSSLQIDTNPDVKSVFNAYPDAVRKKLSNLRELILNAARDIDGLDRLEETLKWGEPSYLTKYGSTIRIDWKEKTPDQYAIYFKCTSKLVPSFREVYGNKFNFEGNRAIVFQMNDNINESDLMKCVSVALNYHKVKQQPLLGLK